MTSTPEAEPTPDTEQTPDAEQSSDVEAAPDAAAAADPAPSVDVVPIDPAVAHELALAALREITPAATIGDPTDAAVADDGVLTLRFENRMPGYPGWFWTVGLAQVADAAPTVLEVELLPGDGSLTAPDWLPWAERLAEYQAAQAALAAKGLATDDIVIVEDDDEDEDLDDVDDLDAADFDSDASPILHSGDVDGVDIDELSDELDDDDSDEDDDSDDDDEDVDESEDDDSDEEDGDDSSDDDNDDDDDSDEDDRDA